MDNLFNIYHDTPLIPFLATIGLLLMAMGANIYLDATQIARNKEIDYSFHNRLMTAVMLAILGAGWAMYLPIKVVLCIAVMIPATRLIVHDYGLNIARGLPLSYLGSRAKTDKTLLFLFDAFGVAPAIWRGLAFLLSASIGLNILMA